MKNSRRQTGFSLTEMLLATAVMAIGLVMVATIFPVGVKLTGLSTERTVAAVVADEAFAKVQLYGVRDFINWPTAESAGNNPLTTYNACDNFIYTINSLSGPGADSIYHTTDDVFFAYHDPMVRWDEFFYPSDITSSERRYHWSALCRRADLKDVQVTVFVSRKTSANASYYGYDNTGVKKSDRTWPMPVQINARYNYSGTASPLRKELVIDASDLINQAWDTALGTSGIVYSFCDEGYTILNNRDGKIYRILQMKDQYPTGVPDGIRETMVLQEEWQWQGYDTDPINPPSSTQLETIWVVPPAVGSARYPCVGVFQKVIRFDNIN